MPSTTHHAPPHSDRLERGALCCLILSERATFRALNEHSLTAQHFYGEENRRLFGAIRECYDEGEYRGCIDLVVLDDRLARKGWDIVSRNYVQEVIDCLPSSAAVDVYVSKLDELLRQRREVAAYELATDLARSGDTDEARAVVAKAASAAPGRDALMSAALQTQDLADQMVAEANGGSIGVSTGFKRLDRAIDGFVPGRAYVLGGLTSVGKTAIVLQFAIEVAKQGTPVYLWSKEMHHRDCRRRMAAVIAGIPLPPGVLAKFTDEQNERYDGAMKMLGQLPIDIDDRPTTLPQMEAHARALRGKVGLFIVDHARLVTVPDARTEYDAISRVSKACKTTFAVECEAACLLLSQFSREAARDRDPKPHQLRGSGTLEEDANVGMTLKRKAYMKRSEKSAEATLEVWKNRDGMCGLVPLEWDKRLARYLEPDEDRVQEGEE